MQLKKTLCHFLRHLNFKLLRLFRTSISFCAISRDDASMKAWILDLRHRLGYGDTRFYDPNLLHLLLSVSIADCTDRTCDIRAWESWISQDMKKEGRNVRDKTTTVVSGKKGCGRTKSHTGGKSEKISHYRGKYHLDFSPTCFSSVLFHFPINNLTMRMDKGCIFTCILYMFPNNCTRILIYAYIFLMFLFVIIVEFKYTSIYCDTRNEKTRADFVY